MIKKVGDKWILFSKDGSKKLGEHDSEAEATKQEQAIEANKHRAAESRQVHLLGATGQIRTATYDSKEYLVVPVVALMEGVIHAINASKPEFVPLSCLACAPQGWNNRPVVLGHPVKDGKQISANSPHVLESQAFGTIFDARIEGKKLLLEAWIDPTKAERVGGSEMLDKIRAGKMCEVSVGAFVVTEQSAGVYGNKSYTTVWRDLVPDHLAFLPKGIGACSIEMGCGSPRAAMAHLVTAEGLETLALPPWLQKKKDGGGDKPTAGDTPDYAAQADEADKKAEAAAKAGDDAEAAKQRKLAQEYRDKAKSMKAAAFGDVPDTPGQAASEEKAELIAYQTMRTLLDQLSQTWDASSQIVDDLIADEEEDPTETAAEEEAEEEVETARCESLQVLCMSMYSTLNALMSLAADLLQPDPVEMGQATDVAPRYMAGARHSASDRSIIQTVHDHTVSLGAECSGADPRAA